MIEKIILNLKEANWMEFSSADEKLRRVLRITTEFANKTSHELGNLETKGIEI